MRGVSLASLNCPVARTLDIVGERWTLLVLRDAFNGVRRYEDFAARLPIARNVLAERLRTLVAHGILSRELYQEHPPRYSYRLTPAGMELYPVIVGLMQWGNRHRMGDAPATIEVHHKTCGHHAEAAVVCTGCGEQLTSRDVRGSLTPVAPASPAGSQPGGAS
jgi:DNA-binding HxlR family transcriptional regulator